MILIGTKKGYVYQYDFNTSKKVSIFGSMNEERSFRAAGVN